MISKCQLVIIACHESDEKGRSKNEVMIGSSLKTKNSQHFNFSMWNILNRPNELTNKKKNFASSYVLILFYLEELNKDFLSPLMGETMRINF